MVVSKEEMKNIMKVVKSVEESGFLIKVGSETIENGAKETKGGFVDMLLGTLSASSLGNLLMGTGVCAGDGVIRTGEGTTRVGQNFQCHLIL